MRAVVSRVREASVVVDGVVVGALTGPGLLALVGVTHTDTPAIATRMAAKLRGLRILAGERSCVDTGDGILVISQFTLYGSTERGRRPSWTRAAPGDVAAPLIDAVVDALRTAGTEVACGIFGADMAVSSTNDGPFTVILDVD
ncbi:MAG: D-aminoacyl-tRNA deacylase [Nakamurella sp.]